MSRTSIMEKRQHTYINTRKYIIKYIQPVAVIGTCFIVFVIILATTLATPGAVPLVTHKHYVGRPIECVSSHTYMFAYCFLYFIDQRIYIYTNCIVRSMH